MYAYDLGDRLTSITPPSASATTFTFDALGRHATRDLPGTSNDDTYSYIGASELVWGVTNPAGNSTSAIDPTGARLATSSAGTTAFTLGDLHGNIAGQVNAAITTVLSALRYDPYGLEAPGGGSYDSGGSFTNPWRYQGRLDVSPDAANPLYDLL
jgi:YD repeat-containing protein